MQTITASRMLLRGMYIGIVIEAAVAAITLTALTALGVL